MKCIFCSGETHVTDKRESPGGTRRRRECLKCRKRFTTYERAEKKAIIVVKKDGRREPFLREKIKLGIIKACEKRPIPLKDIEKILDELEEKLYKKGKEVKSEVIGKMVMNKLKKLDDIAYIRFASVYINFSNIKDFKLALKQV